MSRRIFSALSACGLLEEYKEQFQENAVDDAILDEWIETNSKKSKQEQKQKEENTSTFNRVLTETLTPISTSASTVLENPAGSSASVSKPSDQNANETKELPPHLSAPLLTSKEASERALQFYNESMNFLMIGQGKFHEESFLRQAHEETKEKSIKLFSISYAQSNSGEDKANSIKILVQDLSLTIETAFEILRTKNELNQTKYISKSHSSLANTEKLYKSNMKKFTETTSPNVAKDEEELIAKEIEVNAEVLEHFVQTIQNPSASGDFIQELKKKFHIFTTDWFREELEKFTAKLTQDAFAITEAFYKIKGFYNEEMNKHFLSNNSNFIEPSVLKELDEKITTTALKSCRNYYIKLTPRQQKTLEEEIKVLFKKYEDENKMRRPTSSYAVGIDLGTTNSCVAVYRQGKVEVIENENGKKTTPSFVAFYTDGSNTVGDAAKDEAYENPRNTIFDAKRLIGRKIRDVNVQQNLKSWPFKIVERDGNPWIKIQSQPNLDVEKAETRGGKKRKFRPAYDCYPPEEIAAYVLKKMKDVAEAYLGCEVTSAVITVPALFNDSQRQATKKAGEIAGLKVLRIINEPTAASIAYNLHRQDDLKRNVLIFDLGGGTFDVAVLEIKRGEIEVKSVHGDPNLGGQDFDEEMTEYCIDSFKKQHGIDLSKGKNSSVDEKKYQATSTLRRIQSQCEEKKKTLSSNNKVIITIPNISGNLNLRVPFTRQLFEDLNQKHFDKCLEIVQLALDEAGKRKSEINDIVLVGGSTRIPKLQQMLSNFFDGRALSKTVNPDEAVAIGAAIQACILNGEQIGVDHVQIQDRTSHSIGIKNAYKKHCIEIPKNTKIPCTIEAEYYTLENHQSAVDVEVYEGENPLTKDNNLLGSFRLSGIRTKGREPIQITVQISEEGILSVQARCEKNNVQNEIVISQYKSRLDGEEINEASASL